MAIPTSIHTLLEKHLPASGLAYCLRLWEEHPFDLRLRKKRISKVGDFSFHRGRPPRITINCDSHPFLFLLTYIHEVAHLVVHKQYGNKTEPHGGEWKNVFQSLMAPILNDSVFPAGLLAVLQVHMSDPMASSFSDPLLTRALRALDEERKNVTLLSEIPEGSIFGLHGRRFRKGLLKRTRVQCRELNSKRNYLVPVDAEVEAGQLSLSL